MKVLSGSGGATKFIGIWESAITAYEHGYHPDVIIGVSASAIGCVPFAMGMFDELRHEGLNLELDDFWVKNVWGIVQNPLTKDGNIRLNAIIRALSSKISLGLQDETKLLKKYISPEKFSEYKNGDYATCYVAAINFDTGKIEYWNLKECTYEYFLKYVSASSRIPIMTQPVNIDGQRYFDAGVLDFNAATTVMSGLSNINALYSIYAREENIQPKVDNNWDKNIVTLILRLIEIYNVEIIKTDMLIEKNYVKSNNIKYCRTNLKNLSSLYSVNKDELIDLMMYAKNISSNDIRNFFNKYPELNNK